MSSSGFPCFWGKDLYFEDPKGLHGPPLLPSSQTPIHSLESCFQPHWLRSARWTWMVHNPGFSPRAHTRDTALNPLTNNIIFCKTAQSLSLLPGVPQNPSCFHSSRISLCRGQGKEELWAVSEGGESLLQWALVCEHLSPHKMMVLAEHCSNLFMYWPI